MSWRTRVKNYKHKPFDIHEAFEQEAKIDGKDLGIKSPSSDSVFRISENGRMDLFAKSNLGIRIDPRTNSIMFHAPKLRFYTGSTDIYTSDLTGFRWNFMPFNASAYTPGMPALLPPVDMPSRLMTALTDLSSDILSLRRN